MFSFAWVVSEWRGRVGKASHQPNLREIELNDLGRPHQTLPRYYNTTCMLLNTTPPQPIPWQPLPSPEKWAYTDGSYKEGKPKLGASIIHSPTNTNTYIDASGQEETHTIMRAELVVIHVALDIHKHDPWLGIFTNSKISLHAIQHELQRSSHTTYHHHKPRIAAIVDSLL